MQEISHFLCLLRGCPCGSADKESACSAGDLGSIPGWEDTLEEGMATHSTILTWRISMDRGVWVVTVHGVAKSDTTERLSTVYIYIYVCMCVYMYFLFQVLFIIGYYKILAKSLNIFTKQDIWMANKHMKICS